MRSWASPSRRIAAFGTVASIFFTLPAWADGPIAYDGATASAGPVHGAVSGTNFGAWQSQNGSLDTYRFSGGLTYPYLLSSGNSVVGGGRYETAGVPITTSASGFAPYRSGSDLGADNTTLWASFLLNSFANYDGFNLSLHNSGIAWAPSSNKISVSSTGGYWHLSQGGGPDVSTGIKVDPGRSTLMVVRMQFQAGSADNVTLYVNPTPGVSSPDVAGTQLTTTSSFTFKAASFYPGSGYQQGAVDEIRIGSSYGSVTPYDPSATPQSLPKRMRSFMIGNSLTDNINTEALRIAALARGEMVPWGRQVILGSPLDNIVSNPTQGYLTSPYNGWTNALPNYTWDVVSLEPFDRQLASDKTSIKTLIDTALQNPENAHTQFIVYSRWPRKNGDGTLDYQSAWMRPYTGAYGTEETRAYFETLVTELRTMYPAMEKPVVLAPVGDVFYRLDQMMQANQITGYSNVTQLYADGIHLNDVGSFVVGMTYYATMFKESPVGLPFDSYGLTDAALALQLQQVVWDVTSSNPLAGVPEPGVLMLAPAALAMLLGRRRSRERMAGS